MHPRITLLAGHYGSGKTNIAVNLAAEYRKKIDSVTIADLDIVNPYFRTRDSEALFRELGIRLVCSAYAGSNVDVPALPQELYALTDDRTATVVIDVGGDDRGALVLGRIAPAILEENDYEMLLVINRCRPMTRDADAVLEIRQEIETAGGIPFTGLVNNSNLGAQTTGETVLQSLAYADEVSERTGLPLRMTTVKEDLYDSLRGRIPNLMPLKLQSKIE